MEKKKISLKYIAKRLNISTAVVSVVLNNRRGNIRVSETVKKKIIALADELNYRPNSLARSLKTGKTHTIGLLVSDISNHYYSKLVRSVEDAATISGYNVFICSSDENAEKEATLIQLLENEKYPLVLIDRDNTKSIVPFVGLENQYKQGA